ncbi:MAG: N-6 DNA methylase [Spirochaetales bacterium]|nr:N-6 DNA methylase [Spirochaetales bacterium]
MTIKENKLTLSQLEQYLSKAAWILKGPVDASDFKVYIFPLLFFKRISDVYDEEFETALAESKGDSEYASLPEFHRFEIPKGSHWNDVREKTTHVGLAIEKALRAIEKANQDYLYGIFGDAQWSNKNKLPDKLLNDLIEHFSQYNLAQSNVDPDMLGQALLEMDLLEAVIGLGSNIFYGTQLAACIMVFTQKKPPRKKGKVLFIDASDQIRTGRAQNFLEPEHVKKIFTWYKNYKDVDNYVKVASTDDLKENDYNLNIPLYVEKIIEDDLPSVEEALAGLKEAWDESLKAEDRFKKILKGFIE